MFHLEFIVQNRSQPNNAQVRVHVTVVGGQQDSHGNLPRAREWFVGVRFDVLMTISPLVECRSKANEHMRNTFILTDCYGAPPSRSYIQSLSLFEG